MTLLHSIRSGSRRASHPSSPSHIKDYSYLHKDKIALFDVLHLLQILFSSRQLILCFSRLKIDLYQFCVRFRYDATRLQSLFIFRFSLVLEDPMFKPTLPDYGIRRHQIRLTKQCSVRTAASILSILTSPFEVRRRLERWSQSWRHCRRSSVNHVVHWSTCRPISRRNADNRPHQTEQLVSAINVLHSRSADYSVLKSVAVSQQNPPRTAAVCLRLIAYASFFCVENSSQIVDFLKWKDRVRLDTNMYMYMYMQQGGRRASDAAYLYLIV